MPSRNEPRSLLLITLVSMVGLPPRMESPPTDTATEEALVLVVDDDETVAELVARWLQRAGFDTEVHHDAESMLDGLSRSLPDAVCLDLGLPGMSGQDALRLLRNRHRTVPTIILTADRDPRTVVEAMQGGAYDYLTKPLDRGKVVTTVRNAVRQHRLEARLRQLERDVEAEHFAGIIGRTPIMRGLFRQLDRVAASDITVLIQGESGSGKELVAQAIHNQSARSSGPLVAVNCAAIAPTLQDSELFGHEKGAFTGADRARPGRFEQANGGTLFLDEIAELSPALQAKLLRTLQERRFERVGGRVSIRSDFRLIAATHRNLEQMVASGDFRQDLFFRVAVLELHVPPLRSRRGDVPLLTRALLMEIAEEMGVPCPKIDTDAQANLDRYHWPGNVRELRNTLQRAVVVCEGETIRTDDLPPRLLRSLRAVPSPPEGEQGRLPDLGNTSLAEIERAAIEAALAATGGNLSEVTRRLGIGRATLYRRLKKYGLR